MDYLDQFKLLVGAYYGIRSMDSYNLKEYILKDIEKIIRDYSKTNNEYNLEEYAKEYENLPLITKLQDSLILLNEIDGPLDLILSIKEKINELKNE